MHIFNKDVTYIHCIGAGGIGVSALAKFFLWQGVNVSGSDAKEGEILENLSERGVTITIGHTKEHLPEKAGLVVFSSAVEEDNPELIEAHTRGVPAASYAETLGEIMSSYWSIAITGTNGKTTSTAMLGKMLEQGGVDPLAVVGGKVSGWDGNLRLPQDEQSRSSKQEPDKDQIFIAEACEYRRNMLSISPQAILLTNIESDHLDYFKDGEDVFSAFAEFAQGLPEDGTLFYNADDARSARLAEEISASCSSYSIEKETADFWARNIQQQQHNDILGQSFELVHQNELLGEVFLPLVGRFNVSNALGAAAVAFSFGATFRDVQAALSEFRGSWRRFEHLDNYAGTEIISDYAHHPTAVSGTIEAAKRSVAGGKVLVVFQPHQRDRTQKLFDEFVESLVQADELILPEIYEVSGREDDIAISSQDLCEALEKNTASCTYTPTRDEAKEKIIERINKNRYEMVLFMGAGDIHELALELASEDPARLIKPRSWGSL